MADDAWQGSDVQPATVGALDRGLRVVETGLGAVAAFFILALMLFGVAQVAARVIWNLPIAGYIDYVELMMAVIAFAAIGYAERLGAHIRMDFLPVMLSGRPRCLLEMLLVLIGLATASVLVYATWFSFLRAWQLGDSTMEVQLPIWPSKLLLCVALALLWLRLLFSAIGYALAAARHNG